MNVLYILTLLVTVAAAAAVAADAAIVDVAAGVLLPQVL